MDTILEVIVMGTQLHGLSARAITMKPADVDTTLMMIYVQILISILQTSV